MSVSAASLSFVGLIDIQDLLGAESIEMNGIIAYNNTSLYLSILGWIQEVRSANDSLAHCCCCPPNVGQMWIEILHTTITTSLSLT